LETGTYRGRWNYSGYFYVYFWRKWNENQIHKQMQTDKLEELAIAGKDTQIEI
jgi:hypothetical protein